MEPLQVIAAPRRLRILQLVWDRELAAEFDVTWSAISQHLRVLKAAGFLIERRDGTSRYYRADKAALGSLRGVVEDHWRTSLGRIKDLAETEQHDKVHGPAAALAPTDAERDFLNRGGRGA